MIVKRYKKVWVYYSNGNYKVLAIDDDDIITEHIGNIEDRATLETSKYMIIDGNPNANQIKLTSGFFSVDITKGMLEYYGSAVTYNF